MAGETITSKVVKLHKEKIKYKRIEPSQLELSLVTWPSLSSENKSITKWPSFEKKYTINLHLKGFSDEIVTVATFESSLKALAHYYKILNKLKTNKYELYIYSNGRIKLKY